MKFKLKNKSKSVEDFILRSYFLLIIILIKKTPSVVPE